MKTIILAAALCASGTALAYGPAKHSPATAAATQNAHVAAYSSPNVSGMDAPGQPIAAQPNPGYTGTGGPFVPPTSINADGTSTYPLCTRDLRDSCQQLTGSPRPAATPRSRRARR